MLMSWDKDINDIQMSYLKIYMYMLNYKRWFTKGNFYYLYFQWENFSSSWDLHEIQMMQLTENDTHIS